MRRTDGMRQHGWFGTQSLSQESYYLYLCKMILMKVIYTQSSNAWGNQSFTATNISWRNGWTFSTNEDLFAYCWAEIAWSFQNLEVTLEAELQGNSYDWVLNLLGF